MLWVSRFRKHDVAYRHRRLFRPMRCHIVVTFAAVSSVACISVLWVGARRTWDYQGTLSARVARTTSSSGGSHLQESAGFVAILPRLIGISSLQSRSRIGNNLKAQCSLRILQALRFAMAN